MNNKTRTLRGLVQVFRTLITSLQTDNEFDYGDGSPVDRSTDWDTLPECSALTVFSLNGSNAPSIRHLSPTGFVVTFPANIGGDIQIYLTSHVLAVRKVGSPAGWAYLGLDDTEKIYMDDDTADVLRDITQGFQAHNYVTTDSNQEIDGEKDFSSMPLFDGDRLISHSEFARLTSYVRNNFHAFHKLHDDIIDNSNDTELLSNDYHDIIDSLSNYVKPSDLKNYVPLSQLDYYATKQELTKYVTTDDFQHMQSQLKEIADQAQDPTDDDLARVKDTIHRMNERIETLEHATPEKVAPASQPVQDSDIANKVERVQKVLSQIDLGKVKATIHKMNIRENDLSDKVDKLASEGSSVSAGVSNNTTRLNSADVRFTQLNDSVASDASSFNKLSASASSLSNAVVHNPTPVPNNQSPVNDVTISNMEKGISANASRLNSNASDMYNVKNHFKKANKRYTDAIKSLSANHSDLSVQNSLNSLSTAASAMSANMKIDINSLAGKIHNANNTNINNGALAASVAADQANNNEAISSLKAEIQTTQNSTSSVESTLASALSKGKLNK